MSLRKNPGLTQAVVLTAATLLGALPALAQYPGQVTKTDKDAPSMRSVIVLEWTGDLTKPKASRVIPVSVWDGKELQDGGIYMAKPVPMAVYGDVEYELEQNGKKVGLFDIQNAAKQQQGGWIGFGKWKALPTGPSPQELARIHANVKIDDDAYSDKPTLHRKQHADDSGSSNSGSTEKAPSDPDRPTLHRGDDSGSGSDDASSKGSAPTDPDRPRLHKDSDSASSGDDPDRPKLHNKPAADADVGPVTSVASAGDPDRPKLARGVPEGLAKTDTPTLIGLPPELNQQVGVSDTRTLKDHPWDFTWSDPDDQRKMKEALEDEARKALGVALPPAPEPAPTPKRAPTAARRKAVPPPPPPERAPLLDEQFRVFELSYGGGATLVFSAHTDGAGADQKFVTLIAQPDLYGSAITVLKSVTDAAHLDVNPRMRLIDAVDAEGDNRGELLFELRGENQRQFALYRILRGQATQIFETGSTYFSVAGE